MHPPAASSADPRWDAPPPLPGYGAPGPVHGAPPAGFPARPAQPAPSPVQPAPVIRLGIDRRRNRRSGFAAVIVAMVVCGGALGAVKFVEAAKVGGTSVVTAPPSGLTGRPDTDVAASPDQAAIDAAVAAATGGSTAGGSAVTVAGGSATPSVTDLFAEGQARSAVETIAAARGATPLMAMNVVLYEEYAIADVQDPAQPDHVDSLVWRLGWVEAPQPVRVVHDGPLSDLLFDTSTVRWEAVPALRATALEQLAIEDGEVTHVVVQRPLPFSTEVRMRVFVNGPRETGWLDATADGQVIAVQKA